MANRNFFLFELILLSTGKLNPGNHRLTKIKINVLFTQEIIVELLIKNGTEPTQKQPRFIA